MVKSLGTGPFPSQAYLLFNKLSHEMENLSVFALLKLRFFLARKLLEIDRWEPADSLVICDLSHILFSE